MRRPRSRRPRTTSPDDVSIPRGTASAPKLPAVLRGSAHAIVGRRTARAGGGGDPSPETRLADRASTRCDTRRSSRVTPSLTLTTARFPFVLPEPPRRRGGSRSANAPSPSSSNTHRPPALWIPARGGLHRTRRAARERGEGGSGPRPPPVRGAPLAPPTPRPATGTAAHPSATDCVPRDSHFCRVTWFWTTTHHHHRRLIHHHSSRRPLVQYSLTVQ